MIKRLSVFVVVSLVLGLAGAAPASAQEELVSDFGDVPQGDIGGVVYRYEENTAATPVEDPASHRFNILWLGDLIDLDGGNIPTLAADGDDCHTFEGALIPVPVACIGIPAIAPAGGGGLLDDEDGVDLAGPLVPGEISSVAVEVNFVEDPILNPDAELDAWIDFNSDGDFTDAADQIFDDQDLTSGVNNLQFAVPDTAFGGPTGPFLYARFRLSDGGVLAPTGPHPDGEVEDYRLPLDLDFGDAPNSYQTTAAVDGPRHFIGDLFMGDEIDAEGDGRPTANATGDDTTGTDDEDGVAMGSLTVDSRETVFIESTDNGEVDAWVDFNIDGDFADGNEQVFDDEPVSPGVNSLEFDVPPTATPGTSFARFRLSQNGVATWAGFARTGEVEDYQVLLEVADEDLDWGDAPNPFPTLRSENGARHEISSLFLGDRVDEEIDGQPTADADGDDVNGLDDEDGVTIGPLAPGTSEPINVEASRAGLLDGWIDFDDDGNWTDPGEQVFNDTPLAPGNNPLTVTVPELKARGGSSELTPQTFARFRVSETGVASFTGQALTGEVEDYAVAIQLDFGDAPAPYPTLLADNGARHGFHSQSPIFLGDDVDQDPNGQPTAGADGDDNDGNDDEDGVTFVNEPFTPGQQAEIEVDANGGGFLDGWFDWNQDGDWDDADEHVINDRQLNAGKTTVVFLTPLTAADGSTVARFRFASTPVAAPVGVSPDGEVEDHRVLVGEFELDFGDAPDDGVDNTSPDYQTLLVSNGARHVIANGAFLGNRVDDEANGQPNADATGDDTAGAPDDEDGVTFVNRIVPGKVARVNVKSSVDGAEVNGWLDFNRDGDWEDNGEHVFDDRPVNSGNQELTFAVPPGNRFGPTFARFRLSTSNVDQPEGLAPDGEVEDYKVEIVLECGTTIVGHLVLPFDLNCPGQVGPADDGLYIGDDDVSIDLNGFTISGPGTGIGKGISLPPGGPASVDDFHLFNSQAGDSGIVDFGVGIVLRGHRTVLEDISVQRNAGAGVSLTGDDHLLDNVHMIRNAEDGVRINGNDAVIRASEAAFNRDDGADIAGNNARFRDLASNRNGQHGIELNGSRANVNGSALGKNRGDGIRAVGNLIEVKSNSIDENRGHGVQLSGKQNLVTANLSIFKNRKDGVRMRGAKAKVLNNHIANNTHDGIHILEGAAFEVRDNTAKNNGDDGIDVEEAATGLVRNNIVGPANGDWAIEAHAGVQGGSNTGEPCRPSSLCTA